MTKNIFLTVLQTTAFTISSSHRILAVHLNMADAQMATHAILMKRNANKNQSPAKQVKPNAETANNRNARLIKKECTAGFQQTNNAH